jgi:Leucine-rich repeat (LRR) protein
MYQRQHSRLFERCAGAALQFIFMLSPEDFLRGTSLFFLQLRNSRVLNICNRTFDAMKELRIIYLSYNGLTYIWPYLFTRNKETNWVSLRNNPLTLLRHLTPITSSSSLTHLSLSHCKLTEISSNSLP